MVPDCREKSSFPLNEGTSHYCYSSKQLLQTAGHIPLINVLCERVKLHSAEKHHNLNQHLKKLTAETLNDTKCELLACYYIQIRRQSMLFPTLYIWFFT